MRCGLMALVVLAGAASAVAAPPRVVPWVDEQPVKVSAHPPLATPCRAGALHAHLFLQGATGSLVGGVGLVNAGAMSCSLLGWPTISFTGPAATREKWQVKKLTRSPAPPDVLADPPGSLRALAPGKSATVALFWSNWCGPGATPAGGSGAPPEAIVLRFASGTTLAIPVAHAPRCDAPRYPSTISVAPYTPTERHLPPSSKLPLRVAIVGARPVRVKPGLRAFRVHRSELFDYTVAITNIGTTRFRFASSSCPTYLEQLDSALARAYVLNCRPVSSIPAGKTVLFEMRIAIPADARPGLNDLTWQLAPRTYDAPFASAALWVVR